MPLMDDSYCRPTRLEVNLDILIENYTIISQHVSPCPVMAVLKANAYGHGLIPVAQALIEKANCTHIAVAYLDEGIALREAGIDIPILILGGLIDERITLFLEHELRITA